jgi:AcrR family transcriptional regulator
MARPSKFSRNDVVGAAAALAAASGPAAVTMSAVAASLGAPTGSIYHRFESRQELMAEAWLWASESFQAALIAALGRGSEPGGLEAALHTIQWARDQPGLARLVVLYRRSDFIPGTLPGPFRSRAERLGSELDAALSAFAATTLGSDDLAAKQRAAFLLVDVPQAAVRRYLSAGMAPPPAVDDLVRRAFQALARPQARPD